MLVSQVLNSLSHRQNVMDVFLVRGERCERILYNSEDLRAAAVPCEQNSPENKCIHLPPKPPDTLDVGILYYRAAEPEKSRSLSCLLPLRAGWNVGAVLAGASGFMQSGLNAKMCPRFH